jgi:hypothetical protein
MCTMVTNRKSNQSPSILKELVAVRGGVFMGLLGQALSKESATNSCSSLALLQMTCLLRATIVRLQTVLPNCAMCISDVSD